VFVRISFHDNIRKFLQTLTSPPDRTGRADSCFFNCLFRDKYFGHKKAPEFKSGGFFLLNWIY
jgi:hypothetical protein